MIINIVDWLKPSNLHQFVDEHQYFDVVHSSSQVFVPRCCGLVADIFIETRLPEFQSLVNRLQQLVLGCQLTADSEDLHAFLIIVRVVGAVRQTVALTTHVRNRPRRRLKQLEHDQMDIWT